MESELLLKPEIKEQDGQSDVAIQQAREPLAIFPLSIWFEISTYLSLLDAFNLERAGGKGLQGKVLDQFYWKFRIQQDFGARFNLIEVINPNKIDYKLLYQQFFFSNYSIREPHRRYRFLLEEIFRQYEKNPSLITGLAQIRVSLLRNFFPAKQCNNIKRSNDQDLVGSIEAFENSLIPSSIQYKEVIDESISHEMQTSHSIFQIDLHMPVDGVGTTLLSQLVNRREYYFRNAVYQVAIKNYPSQGRNDPTGWKLINWMVACHQQKAALEYLQNNPLSSQQIIRLIGLAIHYENLPMAEHLIQQFKIGNFSGEFDYGDALATAARKGFKNIVERLLDGGFSPNGVDQNGFTALANAIAFGHVEIVKIFWKAGAKLVLSSKIEGLNTDVLVLGIRRNQSLVVSYLLLTCFTIFAPLSRQKKMNETDDASSTTEIFFKHKCCLLMKIAAEHGALETMEVIWLVIQNSSYVVSGQRSLKELREVFDVSLENTVKYNQISILRYILKNHFFSDLTPQESEEKVKKYFPPLLIVAIQKGYLEIIQELLKYKVDINQVTTNIDGNYRSFLHCAVRCLQLPTVELLLRLGVKIGNDLEFLKSEARKGIKDGNDNTEQILFENIIHLLGFVHYAEKGETLPERVINVFEGTMDFSKEKKMVIDTLKSNLQWKDAEIYSFLIETSTSNQASQPKLLLKKNMFDTKTWKQAFIQMLPDEKEKIKQQEKVSQRFLQVIAFVMSYLLADTRFESSKDAVSTKTYLSVST